MSVPPEEVPWYMHDARTIHRVLLTDPSQCDQLTISGQPRSLETFTYLEFKRYLSPPQQQYNNDDEAVVTALDVNAIAKQAYCDHICERVQNLQTLQPLIDLFLELHTCIRQLIPHRHDLHTLLKDVQVQTVTTLSALLDFIITAGRHLATLESEARSISTREWMEQASNYINTIRNIHDNNNDALHDHDAVRFCVTSLLYLLYKAELCQADKDHFHFTHVWIPRIQAEGKSLERLYFKQHFGDWNDSATAPATRTWIRSLMRHSNSAEETVHFHDNNTRQSITPLDCLAIIQKGWIHTILFRSGDSAVLLPGIFSLDAENIGSIRSVTRMAVAGSALSLHACQVTHQPSTLLEEDDAESAWNIQRRALAREMDAQFKTPHAYIQDIQDAVERLTRSLDPTVSSQDIERVRAKVPLVLQAKDPVVQLLEQRMKDCFESIVVNQQQHSISLASGSTMQSSTRSNAALLEQRLQEAARVFRRQGLAFYALDLASAAVLASNIIDLAWSIHGDSLSNLIQVTMQADR
jgi:hypothetical protein